MVNFFVPMLDHTFAALADPTRRAIVARLAKSSGVSFGELAKPFEMSLPAIIKHIDVLDDAGLLTRTRTGRTVTCSLNTKAMSEAMAWLERHLPFWNSRLDALAELVELQEATAHDNQKRTRRRSRQTPG